MNVTLSVDFESAVTSHWPNDLPVIQSVPMEGEGEKGSMREVNESREASCSPREVKEQVQSPLLLLLPVVKDDITSSSQAITGNGSLREASSTAKAAASRNVDQCGGTLQRVNGRPLGWHCTQKNTRFLNFWRWRAPDLSSFPVTKYFCSVTDVANKVHSMSETSGITTTCMRAFAVNWSYSCKWVADWSLGHSMDSDHCFPEESRLLRGRCSHFFYAEECKWTTLRKKCETQDCCKHLIANWIHGFMHSIKFNSNSNTNWT